MRDISSVGGRIKSERERLGLTQAEFGQHAGITRLTQSKYESGASSPDINYLTKIESAGVDIGYIIDGTHLTKLNAEKEFSECVKRAGDIVVALEKELIASGKNPSPERKGALVKNILRACRPGRPIDMEVIRDFLSFIP
ncbi:helix-turn-helix protein [mine drainage metagenome]|uniref:Helix-turn-helix protein n=1 Tax=mine drainage metagenome TaxID=410659 RepID=A0A1J5TST5_9ZZZZ